MNAALNQQVGNEFGASIEYVAIAAYFASEGLPTLAERFFQQAGEERDHAMRFVKYVLDAGAELEIPAIPAPKGKFKSAEDAVKQALDWEKTVTSQVNALVKLAVSESDYTTQCFLNWFVTEQLEEVSSMDNLLKLVRQAGKDNLIYVEASVAREMERAAKAAGAESAD
jgi:ferritin